MSESFEEVLARHFRENTRLILETTREMIQESREQTLDETRGMIQEAREETRGLIEETRGMIRESEHRMTILLEDIRGDVRAVAEGVEMNRQRFDRIRTEDRQDIDDLDVRVTRLEAQASTG